MRLLSATAAAALALTAGGCEAESVHRAVARLDCPQSEDGLRRVSQAADGKTCDYVSNDGAQITLKLIPVSGGVDATLDGVEANLRAELKGEAPPAEPAAKAGAEAPADAVVRAEPGATTARDAAAAEAQAQADVGAAKSGEPRATATATAEAVADSGETDSGETDQDWSASTPAREKTRVDLPGVHIVADDSDDSAQVRIGPLHIDAGKHGAVVRMQRDVRLKGESLSPAKNGVRATFILAGEDLPGGYKFAGYEAGGPRSGPLTVAVVKGRDGGDHDDVYDAVSKLVRRNGGV
ncbi:hypothetical protein [Phenylobacterium sp.]|uniref:hypothetical protein n=1 Tax=Phenylobacterium sp. TaxID=1871053 RepID=UPI0035B310C8